MKKEERDEIAKRNFLKIPEIGGRASSTEAAYSEHSLAIHSIPMAGYVTVVQAFVWGELPVRDASTFCDLKKKITAFFSFCTQANLYILMCLIRTTI